MSIVDWAREGGISGFDIECDECGQTQNYDRTYFKDFIVDIRADGWKSIKDEVGDWTHLCPTYAAKESQG